MKKRLIVAVLLTMVLVLNSACQNKNRERLPIDFNKLKESSTSYDFYIKVNNKSNIVELYSQSKSQDTRGVSKIKNIAQSKLNNNEVCFRSDSITKITVVDKNEKLILKKDKCVPKGLLEHKNKIIFTHKSGNSITVKLMGCDEV